nr:MAG TPA: CRISPR-associated exonuclease [Crassvirales sp.]
MILYNTFYLSECNPPPICSLVACPNSLLALSDVVLPLFSA